MRDHKALLDIATHTVHLDSPDHGTVVVQLLAPLIAHGHNIVLGGMIKGACHSCH
jgi:hypothetical protein